MKIVIAKLHYATLLPVKRTYGRQRLEAQLVTLERLPAGSRMEIKDGQIFFYCPKGDDTDALCKSLPLAAVDHLIWGPDAPVPEVKSGPTAENPPKGETETRKAPSSRRRSKS